MAEDWRVTIIVSSTDDADDVLRALWQRYGRDDRPVPERGLEQVVRSNIDLIGLTLDCELEPGRRAKGRRLLTRPAAMDDRAAVRHHRDIGLRRPRGHRVRLA